MLIKKQNAARIKDAVEALRAVGTHHPEDVTELIEELNSLHRTEQQNVVRLLIAGLRTYGIRSEDHGAFDARNEASVKYCANLPDLCAPYI